MEAVPELSTHSGVQRTLLRVRLTENGFILGKRFESIAHEKVSLHLSYWILFSHSNSPCTKTQLQGHDARQLGQCL